MTSTEPDLHPLLRSRWSPTVFDRSHEATQSSVTSLLEAARWAPSAGNSQPWSFIVAKRRDENVGPESGAVFPKPPSLIFHPSGFNRRSELSSRLVVCKILFGIENRKVLPYDLVRFIALESLSACVPAEDVAIGIEREDGIVDHPLHKETIKVARRVSDLGVFVSR